MPHEKTIPCPDCDRLFSGNTQLAVHRATAHAGKPAAAPKKPARSDREPDPTPQRTWPHKRPADDDDQDDVVDAFL